jgi:hypothetical protein
MRQKGRFMIDDNNPRHILQDKTPPGSGNVQNTLFIQANSIILLLMISEKSVKMG